MPARRCFRQAYCGNAGRPVWNSARGKVCGKVCGNDLPHARRAYRHEVAAAMPAVTTLQLLTHGNSI